VSPTVAGFAAVGAGAALGAWMRWGLSLWLNARNAHFPYGTLAANLIGGYLVGLAVAYFAQNPNLDANARLFVITGFLGGLTTFSTYSAEVVTLLQRGEPGWALAVASGHLAGSLILTALGFATFRAFQ
jgi:fluoride exporter